MRSLSYPSLTMSRALFLSLLLALLLAVACAQDDAGVSGPKADTPVAGVTPSSPSTSSAGRAEKGASAEIDAGATATQPPAPTPDPQQDVWTLFVYLSAGGDLVEAATQDLNEMEAAGRVEGVNVVVQVGGIPAEDGAGDGVSQEEVSEEEVSQGEDSQGEAAEGVVPAVRRYQIEADDDANSVASPTVGEVGDVAMDDPGTLADFVAWGVDRYPANRYALILVERGGPVLTGADIDAALAQTAERIGPGRLDVVGFDVALAGHLELFHAIGPYARYAAAAAGPFPEQGWAYDSLLRDLYGQPELSAARLASLMAAAAPRSPALAAAVDLQAVPAISRAVDNLAATLEDGAELALAARALSDARRSATVVAPAAPAAVVPHAAVDLGRFATILAQRSPLRSTAAAAGEVAAAVATANVTAEEDDAGTSGLALAFPRNAAAGDDASADRPFSSWRRLLARSYQAAAAAEPPLLHVARAGEGPASVRQPAHLATEVAGRDVAGLSFVAGLPSGDGRLRLVAHTLLVPEQEQLSGAGALYGWREGVHEHNVVWETTAAYLSDGENGNFVVLWPTVYGDEGRAVRGRFRRSGAEGWREAALLFGGATGEAEAIWTLEEEEGAGVVRHRALRRGDAFQPYDVYLGPEGALQLEPGVDLAFDVGPLLLERRPLPGGDVRLGVVAETTAGARIGAFADLAVDNGGEAPGAVAYLDADDGFQFLYPADWRAPALHDGALRAADPNGETTLTVSRFPGLDDDAAAELKSETLNLFGAVDVLYEEPVFVGGANGLLTAYGYEGADGARTGIFFTFAHEGVGYVVDVDGPTEREAETIAIVDRLVEGWTFRPAGAEQLSGHWRRVEAGLFTVAVPQDVRHEMLDNGWQRFSGEDVFISLRRDPSSGATRQGVLEEWLAVAARGVERFTAEDAARFALAGRLWARADFEYEGRDGAVRGFVMAAVVGGEEIVAWAEAPAAAFEEQENAFFLMLAADAVAGLEGDGGVLYTTSFDGVETWGGGSLEGAEGTVEDGAYRLSVTAPEGFFWTTAGRSFGDGVYEVEATHAAGPLDNGFGLIFRADPGAGAFYVFESSSDGFVWIGRCEDGCAQMATLVGDGWFFSDAVRRGAGVANRLRVEAAGPDLLFFVNGVEVGRARDAALGEGDVGLFVETRGEGDVGVAFDNVRVTDF